MKLKYVKIKEYKNLKDFEVKFDTISLVDIFLGKNGSGKSNFFEALLEIFKHLYSYSTSKSVYALEYKINYILGGKEYKFENIKGQVFYNGEPRERISKRFLPDSLIVYYSGHNSVISTFLKRIHHCSN